MKEEKINKQEIISALKEISRIKGIDEDLLFVTLEDALTAAYRKNYNESSEEVGQDIVTEVHRETGEIRITNYRRVVEEVEDEASEISLEQAKVKHPGMELGDRFAEDVTPKNFMRVAAQTAKQIVTQRIKEAERSIIYNEFKEKEHDLVSGLIQRKDKENVYVNLGRIEAVLLPKEQIPGESYEFNQRLELYISEVRQNPKGSVVAVSRTHPNLVRRLFEREVPEIYEGIVEIKSISREAGSRTKIAVVSHQEGVDATGACVGNRGSRVQNVVSELKNEKMDIIEWDKDPALFIANSLSPAKVQSITLNPAENAARVIVEDGQLSLAIGKEGQNVRLAAKLTGWKIDIKSDHDPEAMAGFEAFAHETVTPLEKKREVPLAELSY
ncbi:Transcription termination protein NusA [Clostridiaceae bacterium JG1575]|nr:Transcription termination protein NusA [Clostridiaceae bacterium JG1575]